ncbi:hypothetical protein ACTA71_003880 [Dictyostelium dimigraforme]
MNVINVLLFQVNHEDVFCNPVGGSRESIDIIHAGTLCMTTNPCVSHIDAQYPAPKIVQENGSCHHTPKNFIYYKYTQQKGGADIFHEDTNNYHLVMVVKLMDIVNQLMACMIIINVDQGDHCNHHTNDIVQDNGNNATYSGKDKFVSDFSKTGHIQDMKHIQRLDLQDNNEAVDTYNLDDTMEDIATFEKDDNENYALKAIRKLTVNNTKFKPLKERKQIMVEFIQDPTIDQRFISVLMDLAKYELENNKSISPNAKTTKIPHTRFQHWAWIPLSLLQSYTKEVGEFNQLVKEENRLKQLIKGMSNINKKETINTRYSTNRKPINIIYIFHISNINIICFFKRLNNGII